MGIEPILNNQYEPILTNTIGLTPILLTNTWIIRFTIFHQYWALLTDSHGENQPPGTNGAGRFDTAKVAAAALSWDEGSWAETSLAGGAPFSLVVLVGKWPIEIVDLPIKIVMLIYQRVM